MSDKEQQREIFIEKRSHALAMMLLTRREDLRIEEGNEDIGVDYIVRFPTEAKDGLREFAIQLKGAWAAATKEQADKMIRSSLRQKKRHGALLRPVCLFLFTMENDEAWYTWIVEPLEAEDGKPLLRLCSESDCRHLDNKTLKEIIDRVDLWYDAAFQRLIVNGTGRSKTKRRQVKP